MADRRPRSTLMYLAVLAGAVCCYAALGTVLEILPRDVPGRLGGGSAATCGRAGGCRAGIAECCGLMARWFDERRRRRFMPIDVEAGHRGAGDRRPQPR